MLNKLLDAFGEFEMTINLAVSFLACCNKDQSNLRIFLSYELPSIGKLLNFFAAYRSLIEMNEKFSFLS